MSNLSGRLVFSNFEAFSQYLNFTIPIYSYETNYYENTILCRNDNITEEAVYNEKNSKMSKRHSHGSSKKSSSKQHKHSSHKHRSQSESNNSNGVDALHVDHDQLGGAANNGSTSCRNFGSGIQIKKFREPFVLPVPWVLESVHDFLIKLGIKPLMHLLEISIFSLNNVILRLTKIVNKDDQNWAHF